MKNRPRLRVVVSFRAMRSRLSRFLTGSFAVHGALIAAIVVVPATRHRVTPIDDSMVVSLAGPIAEAPAPRGGAASVAAIEPATPPPPPPPKEAHTVPEVPKPKPKEQPKEKEKEKPVTPKAEPEPAPDSPAPSSKTKNPSPSPQGGLPGEAPGAAGSAVTAMVGRGDSALAWYGAAVKAALESVWVKPFLEDAHGTASVVIFFEIARDGTARNIGIQESSGIPSLDRSAQRAAIEASPFPAVPRTWTEDTIPVTMRFDLSPDSH